MALMGEDMYRSMMLQKMLEESWRMLLRSLEAFLTAERFMEDAGIQFQGNCLPLYLHPEFCSSCHRMPTSMADSSRHSRRES
jgi:hypothetical protein